MPLWVWVVGFTVLLVLFGVWFDRRGARGGSQPRMEITSHGDADPRGVGDVHPGGFTDGGGGSL